MAFVYVCDACLDGDHEACEVSRGSGECNCAHGEPETDFQRSIRERSEAMRARRALGLD